jgi:periplasmic copper chaperone A
MAGMKMRSVHDWYWVFIFGLAAWMIAIDAEAILIVSEPWVRISPNSRSAEGYVQLQSTEGATLVGIRSDATANIEMRQSGNTRASVGKIELPAGQTVMLAPGGQRFVLTGVRRRLKLGDHVAFVLTFMSADGKLQEIHVNAEVRQRSPTDDHLRGHRH